MNERGSITAWIGDLRDGRNHAAQDLWQRYYNRLIALARKRLGDSPRRMADEEDVVIRAFNSFCTGAAEGRFPRLNDREDLWQILVMLTARKATDQVKTDQRLKRGAGLVRGDSAFLDQFGPIERAQIDLVVGQEPSPDFAAQVAEELERLLNALNDVTLKTVALAKMEGYSNVEIAERLKVQTRTIERKLRLIREIWTAAGFA